MSPFSMLDPTSELEPMSLIIVGYCPALVDNRALDHFCTGKKKKKSKTLKPGLYFCVEATP